MRQGPLTAREIKAMTRAALDELMGSRLQGMAKSWSRRAPKTKVERKALLARCGRKAFLDPANLKFPIMAKSGPCVPDCAGLKAAKSRAGQFHRRKIKAKAARAGRACVR